MCVHSFGLISSPSVAGYALKRAAADNIDIYGKAAADAVMNNFYVDDLCKSETSASNAISMITAISSICASRGFNLTKLVTNNQEVLQNIPPDKRVKELQHIDLCDVGF